jgi:arsenate reductase
MPKRVLILCTGNSCRSQMAEALWTHEGHGQWEAVSAGSKPAGYVHPLAIAAMAEIGIDLSQQRSEHVDLYKDRPFDLVVTVCDNARESCPAIPGARQILHWPFDDPHRATGKDEERMVEFRRVRDEIHQRVRQYLLADAQLDGIASKNSLER